MNVFCENSFCLLKEKFMNVAEKKKQLFFIYICFSTLGEFSNTQEDLTANDRLVNHRKR